MNGELRKGWKWIPVSVYLRQEADNNCLDATPSEIYSYVDERYFDDLIEMAGRIASSAAKGERWLIFVRRKEDGELLQTFLESHRCKSVTVTARTTKNYDGRRVPRRSPRNRALDALVWQQELGCNVLISTSVLDNGISLHADAVDHLVLCQPGKTKQGGPRESYWTIEKRDETKESEHPLQDAPTLTDSQDTSGGSCSPSSGIPVG